MKDQHHPARDVAELTEIVDLIDLELDPSRVVWPEDAQFVALDVALAAYQLGQRTGVAALRTPDDVATELGISVQRLSQVARARGVGVELGRYRYDLPEDVDALRDRPPGRPSKLIAAQRWPTVRERLAALRQSQDQPHPQRVADDRSNQLTE